MGGVDRKTLLWSEATGPRRAWELGESSATVGRYIETIWLPPLIITHDATIETYRGQRHVSQVIKGDWLKCIREPFTDFQPDDSYELVGPTGITWERLQSLSWGQGCHLVDLAKRQASNRDRWILLLRQYTSYYGNLAREGQDCWWFKVLETRDGMMDLVTIAGPWRAYGVPIVV